jgi:hypothetical protein
MRLSVIGKKKSVGADGIPGEIFTLFEKVVIPYLYRLLDIKMNNNTPQMTGKKLYCFLFTTEEIDS